MPYIWRHDRLSNSTVSADFRRQGYEYLEKGTLHGLPNALRSTNCCSRTFWTTAVVVGLTLQAIHMAILFGTALENPTVTNIRYARVQELAMPFMTLCGHPGKFFDSVKLQASNLNLSVALMFASMYGMFDPSVPYLSELEDEVLFENAMALNVKLFSHYQISNSHKISLFLLNYTIDCEDLLYGCQQGFMGAGVKRKCCRSFKPVMTGRGLCYAFDHSSWKVSNVAGVFAGLSFYLNHSRLSFEDPVYDESPKFGALSDVSVTLSNGVEQSPLTNNYVTVGPGDDVQVTVTSTRVKLLTNCDSSPKLDFYHDYTINNCVWERG